MGEKSYHTIRNIKLGQTDIEVCVESIPTEEQLKRNLTKIYDVVNSIARKAENRGIDTSKWFYTEQQLQLLKAKPENTFL